MHEEHVTRLEFEKLYKQINGNGQSGIVQNLNMCISQLDAIRGAQEERAKIDKRRWATQTILISLLTLLVGILGLLLASDQKRQGVLHIPGIWRSTREKILARDMPQDAAIPVNP